MATLGFSKVMIKPCPKITQNRGFNGRVNRWDCFSAPPSPLIIETPSHSKYKTPPHLTTAKAQAEAMITADRPIIAKMTWTNVPPQMPSMAAKPDLRPPLMVCAKIKARSAPGDSVKINAAEKNVSQCDREYSSMGRPLIDPALG